MNLDKKAEYIFDNINNLEDMNTYNVYTLLDISEPLMFVLNELNKYFIAYVLQNRTAILKNGEKADVIEVLFVNTNTSKIKKMLEGQMDIKDVFVDENMSRLGRVGNKVFPKKAVNTIHEVENKIPRTGVRLDHTLPNKINTRKILRLIEAETRMYESYTINDENIFKREFLHVEMQGSNHFQRSAEKEDYINNETYDFRIEVSDEI